MLDGMTERRLWIFIAGLLLAILLILASRRWSAIDPDVQREIEKAKQR
jgi:hypothetical protein